MWMEEKRQGAGFCDVVVRVAREGQGAPFPLRNNRESQEEETKTD